MTAGEKVEIGRSTVISRATPESRAALDALIRRYQYANIDLVRAQLEPLGMKLARNTLWRYMRRLQRSDSHHAGTPDDVLVVVIERSTGATATLTTAVSASAVLAAISKLGTLR